MVNKEQVEELLKRLREIKEMVRSCNLPVAEIAITIMWAETLKAKLENK